MPTQSTTYNSRVTDEALEKRFRDTFRSQGGAELVDDLYAQGVIVPVVDFTAAATGQQLAQNLQTAWDFTTATVTASNNTQTIASNAGFWLVQGSVIIGAGNEDCAIQIDSGVAVKEILRFDLNTIPGSANNNVAYYTLTAFLRSSDSLEARSSGANTVITASARQIATLNGDLVNPSGFTSS